MTSTALTICRRLCFLSRKTICLGKRVEYVPGPIGQLFNKGRSRATSGVSSDESYQSTSAKLRRIVPTLLLGTTISFYTVTGYAETAQRNANIWDGLAHQPSRIYVRQGEREDGIQLNGTERSSVDAKLQQLGQQLLANHLSQDK